MIDIVRDLRKKKRTKLVNYLISMSKNKAINYVTREEPRSPYSLDELQDSLDSKDGEHEIELRLIKEEELRILASIWPKLDEKSRYLLEARYTLKKSYNEISRDLGISPSHARVSVSRAREKAYRLFDDKMKRKDD